ncbi:ABC transporter ATP-binding protein [Paenibacillus sp. Leaf72]|uniref:ABC transporter ATP-binding protein n=1 Tax=Paenibacillus sp. Leaf72 TaxID=1736234 RepID=UPI0006F84BE3|nr:ABC transporter ATP-binding protein [Paenibacillus sp. Leaf72]KQO10700.1 nitrate/sulfonate/bicarbonate ABC transporter ATP-binding protein [Paenibacillus sp. Leaf72]
MIQVEGVGKTFAQRGRAGYTALKDIDFKIGKGEFVSILGPSGCGKSTLLNLVAGLERADYGRVEANGKEVTAPGPDRIVVFQDHALYPWLTVLENVAFGLKQKGIKKKERRERAMEQIRAVHLGKFADRYPHELSGGMKQRVAIARALVMDPEILLMDEPFAALDEQTRLLLHKELEQIWLSTGKTILFITHNIREAVILSDRVLVMSTRPGRIKKEFRVQAARPREPGDSLLHHIESQIMDTLAAELEKVAKEEYGNDYTLEKSPLSHSTANNLGDGI